MYILICSNGSVLPFTENKKYDVGVGYIALYEPSENCCVLLRYLREEELELFENVHYVCDCTNEPLTNGSFKRISKPALMLNPDAKDFHTTDLMIEKYRKGIVEMEKYMTSESIKP